MRRNAIIIQKNLKKASSLSFFIRIVNTIVTEIRKSNFISHGNGIILLGINCRLILNKKNLRLTFNFTLRNFCFSFNY